MTACQCLCGQEVDGRRRYVDAKHRKRAEMRRYRSRHGVKPRVSSIRRAAFREWREQVLSGQRECHWCGAPATWALPADGKFTDLTEGIAACATCGPIARMMMRLHLHAPPARAGLIEQLLAGMRLLLDDQRSLRNTREGAAA